MFTGLALMLLVLHLSAPRPDIWELIMRCSWPGWATA